MKTKDKNGRRNTPKAIESERDKRTLTVLRWLSVPHSRQEILAKGRTEFKLQTRAMDEYIHKAKALLKEQFLKDVDENKGIIITKLWTVYEEAMKGHPRYDRFGVVLGMDPDYAAANSALKSIAQIQGVLTSKHEIELLDDGLDEVPTEVLLRYVKNGNTPKNQ